MADTTDTINKLNKSLVGFGWVKFYTDPSVPIGTAQTLHIEFHSTVPGEPPTVRKVVNIPNVMIGTISES